MRHVKSETTSNDAVYTIRVDRDLLDRMHEIAASEHRTLSGKVRAMFEAEVAQHGEQVAA